MTDNGPELDSGDDWIEKLGSTSNVDKAGVKDSAGVDLFMVHGDNKLSGGCFLDEDNMTSDDADKVPSQQSVKAYVDSEISTHDHDSDYANIDHDTTHITGGSDEIDGDRLNVDWDPSEYTPSTSPAEASNSDDLTAHLKGIDDELGDKVSATNGFSSDFPINENGIIFDDNLSAVGQYSGLIVTEQTLDGSAGNAIAVGDTLYYNNTGNWEPADATSSSTMICAGISLGTCNSGTTNNHQKVLIQGFIRAAGYSLNVGSMAGNSIVYVNTTAGGVTQTQPAATGNIVQPIGHGHGAGTLYFKPDYYYKTVP